MTCSICRLSWAPNRLQLPPERTHGHTPKQWHRIRLRLDVNLNTHAWSLKQLGTRFIPSDSLLLSIYSVEKESVRVYAVLDCRRNPLWIRKRLKENG
jgi:hypothetical protein